MKCIKCASEKEVTGSLLKSYSFHSYFSYPENYFSPALLEYNLSHNQNFFSKKGFSKKPYELLTV